MRENMASLFLHQCGYDGKEPSSIRCAGPGTFVIEAAEIAAGLNPAGRGASLSSSSPASMRRFGSACARPERARRPAPSLRASDLTAATMTPARSAWALPMPRGRASPEMTEFRQCEIGDLTAPSEAAWPGHRQPTLWCQNRRYAGPIPVSRARTKCCWPRFAGWRVGLLTSDTSSEATAFSFLPTIDMDRWQAPGVSHGGVRVMLFPAQLEGSASIQHSGLPRPTDEIHLPPLLPGQCPCARRVGQPRHLDLCIWVVPGWEIMYQMRAGGQTEDCQSPGGAGSLVHSKAAPLGETEVYAAHRRATGIDEIELFESGNPNGTAPARCAG